MINRKFSEFVLGLYFPLMGFFNLRIVSVNKLKFSIQVGFHSIMRFSCERLNKAFHLTLNTGR